MLHFKDYFYKLIGGYINYYVRPKDSIVEINPRNRLLGDNLVCENISTEEILENSDTINCISKIKGKKPDYVLLNGNLHYEKDIQLFLETIRQACNASTRLIVCYYSALWQPVFSLAEFFSFKTDPRGNWFSPSDLVNFAAISGFEIVQEQQRVIFPLWIPVISTLLNKFVLHLPFGRLFALANIAVLRPVKYCRPFGDEASVSVVVAARNEEGNVENIVKRLPRMGPSDELIIIEGGSTDNTWDEMARVKEKYAGSVEIIIDRQDGTGKGDAVRKGFSLASKEILMILDADLTVPPEDLPKFYNAIKNNTGEFINGSRLMYKMEREAMRFFNILGNKFFAAAFSMVLRQPIKDTLCGTKVISRKNYIRLANNRSFFGEFDPFGDFDLIFGASRMGLKIIEIPITYKARTYGDTNISRWRHGVILLKMLFFALKRIKFL